MYWRRCSLSESGWPRSSCTRTRFGGSFGMRLDLFCRLCLGSTCAVLHQRKGEVVTWKLWKPSGLSCISKGLKKTKIALWSCHFCESLFWGPREGTGTSPCPCSLPVTSPLTTQWHWSAWLYCIKTWYIRHQPQKLSNFCYFPQGFYSLIYNP